MACAPARAMQRISLARSLVPASSPSSLVTGADATIAGRSRMPAQVSIIAQSGNPSSSALAASRSAGCETLGSTTASNARTCHRSAIVGTPGRIERVDPNEQRALAEPAGRCRDDGLIARSLFQLGRDRILEIEDHHVAFEAPRLLNARAFEAGMNKALRYGRTVIGAAPANAVARLQEVRAPRASQLPRPIARTASTAARARGKGRAMTIASMTALWRSAARFLGTFARFAGMRGWIAVGLVGFSAILDGAGLVLLIPIVDAVVSPGRRTSADTRHLRHARRAQRDGPARRADRRLRRRLGGPRAGALCAGHAARCCFRAISPSMSATGSSSRLHPRPGAGSPRSAMPASPAWSASRSTGSDRAPSS